MKKLLSLIGALILTTGLGTLVVACDWCSEKKPTQIALNKIIIKPELGDVYGGKIDQPTKQLIKMILKTKYDNLDENKIRVNNITSNSAKITSADLNIYTGEVNITYNINNFTKMTGTIGEVRSLTIDANRTVYAGTETTTTTGMVLSKGY